MIPFLLFIPPDTPNKTVLTWTFKTAILALNLKHVIVANEENAAYETIRLDSETFRSRLSQADFSPIQLLTEPVHFSSKGVIEWNGIEDELLTAFYLINCLQEYNSSSTDQLGRFKYENSFQQKYNKVTENFVTELFDAYFKKHLPHPLRNKVQEKSRFFFSHDIDSLYGAFLQDGLAALKGGRFDVITRLIVNAVFLNPDWFNIDEILKIDNNYDLRSTFFWIVNKGRVNKTLTNSDYNIRSIKVKKALKSIRDNGSHIGLHKSISDESFDKEAEKLGYKIIANRNHYLKFSIPQHFEDLSKSSIKIDCSLGYAEQYGFRNSLAIPFVPFRLAENETYDFLEVPLNVMDGTFQKYMQTPSKKVSQEIISFIENNKYNSVISVLWHNHFFSSYRFSGFFEPYAELLEYLKKNNFSAISPDQLYHKYFFTVK